MLKTRKEPLTPQDYKHKENKILSQSFAFNKKSSTFADINENKRKLTMARSEFEQGDYKDTKLTLTNNDGSE